ncbi:MAG: hypothetical protein HPY50_12865 [Firmicutes bacterium]|nr:hypothetical protein [Bacillota bacterium]
MNLISPQRKSLNKRIVEWGITLLVAAAVLIAVDFWAGQSFGGPPPFESFYRFSGELKPGEFQRQVKSIEGEQGIRVAFLGDSVIRGTAVAESKQTIPAYLQKSINSDPDLRSRGIKVFNFGIAGARDADKYGVLKTLLDRGAVDLVVMNVSYPFYSEEILKIPVQFPHIYYDAFSPQEKSELGIADPAALRIGGDTDWGVNKSAESKSQSPDQAVAGSKLEQAIVDRGISRWNLYRYRVDINSYLFGGHPVQEGRKLLEKRLGKKLTAREVNVFNADVEGVPVDQNNLAAKDRPENLIKTYDQFEWAEPEIQHLRKVFRVGPVDEKNIGYRYLEKTLLLARQRGVRVVIFLSPVNTALLDEHLALDRDDWQRFTTQVKGLESVPGVSVCDLQNSVEPRFFHDSLHMVDEGNEQTARVLYRQIKPELMGLAK